MSDEIGNYASDLHALTIRKQKEGAAIAEKVAEEEFQLVLKKVRSAANQGYFKYTAHGTLSALVTKKLRTYGFTVACNSPFTETVIDWSLADKVSTH